MSSKTVKVRVYGRYQVLDELGRGGMGVVYRGFDPVIGRTVAIKTIEFDSNDAEARELKARLHREASAAGTLSHPNIVTVFDVVELDDTTAVAMEFVEGRDLSALIAERAPLPLDEAIGIFEQICSALEYAWGHGIVHRDIKPANILLTKDGRVKVADFGVARVADSKLTKAGTVVGSPDYMSPEQVRGRALDGRSDLFSATVVLYEMLTNTKPFGGDDLATTMYRIVHDPPRPFTSSAHDPVSAVFERALAKDPDARHASGREIAVELQRAMRGAAASPAAATPHPGRPKPAQYSEKTEVIAIPAPLVLPPIVLPPVAPAAAPSAGATVAVPRLANTPAPQAGRTVAVPQPGAEAPQAVPSAPVPITPTSVTVPATGGRSSSRPAPRGMSVPMLAGAGLVILAIAAAGGWLVLKRGPAAGTPAKPSVEQSAPGQGGPPAPAPTPAAAPAAGAAVPPATATGDTRTAVTKPPAAGGARTADNATVYESNQVDVPPKVLSNPGPAYPPDARQKRLEDVVVLSVLVSEYGRPVELKVLKKSQKAQSFDTAATAAVRTWTFKPAQKKGQKVRCWFNVAVPFQLRR